MGREGRQAPLLACVGMDRHLVARCASPGCSRSAPCDPTIWVAQGLGGLPLRAFAERLRCVCGSRKGRLVIEDGPFPQSAMIGELYVFR
jgi:hypothetical protein